MHMQYLICVKGIITRSDGKILVLKRSAQDDHAPSIWETVGGAMDTEETPQTALEREIKEETGLTVAVLNPFNVFTIKKDTGESKVGITFLCNYISGEVMLSEEHEEYRWIHPDEFATMKSAPSLHREIEAYTQSRHAHNHT